MEGPRKAYICHGCDLWALNAYLQCPIYHGRRDLARKKAEEPINYDSISPGVRDLVRELRARGFDTTDSGDGSNHAAGMEGALPFRHVVISVDPMDMAAETLRLAGLYPDARVELTWSPGEPAAILLLPDGYDESSLSTPAPASNEDE